MKQNTRKNPKRSNTKRNSKQAEASSAQKPTTTMAATKPAQHVQKKPATNQALTKQPERVRNHAATTAESNSGMSKSSKTSAPVESAGDSRTLQVMTRGGVLREVVIRQATTFELVVANAGAKDTQEFLCDSVTTASQLGDMLKKQGARVQRGERRIGF